MISISNITKAFNRGDVNEVTALNGVNLEVKDGDFITIIGSNGAGKSTFLNALAGSFPVDSGKIVLEDLDITKWPEHKRASLIGPGISGSPARHLRRSHHRAESGHGQQARQVPRAVLGRQGEGPRVFPGKAVHPRARARRPAQVPYRPALRRPASGPDHAHGHPGPPPACCCSTSTQRPWTPRPRAWSWI